MADILAKSNAKLRLNNFRSLGDWRETRVSLNHDASIYFGKSEHGTMSYTFDSGLFRNEQFVDEVKGTGIDHRGWYSDAECSETYRGFVFNLSHGRYGAGQYRNMNGERIYYCNVFTDVSDAASFADSCAEQDAEEEKEYSERWQAKCELEDEIEAAKPNMARCFALRNHPDLGGDARSELELDIAVMRNKLHQLETEFEGIE